MAALEKAKQEKPAHGEIETYYSCFLVVQKLIIMQDTSKGGIFISRRSSILTPKDLPNGMTGKMRLSLPTCSCSFFRAAWLETEAYAHGSGNGIFGEQRKL